LSICSRFARRLIILSIFFRVSSAAFLPSSFRIKDATSPATNTRGEEYGEDRLRQELDDDANGESATLHRKLMQGVSEFCQGNFADDATLVLISFQP
jgi:hypothetical protein